MDEIDLLRSLARHAGSAPEVVLDAPALRRKVWDTIDAQPETDTAPLFYLVAACAVAASLVLFFTWDCQDLLSGSLFWLDPVTEQYSF